MTSQELLTDPLKMPPTLQEVEVMGADKYAEVAGALHEVIDFDRLARWSGGTHNDMEVMAAAAEVVRLPHFYSEHSVRVTPLKAVRTSWDHVTLADKLDTEQQICAFKARGAHAGAEAIMRQYPDTRHLGTHSAGNHALGLALWGRSHNERVRQTGEGELVTIHTFMKQGAAPDKVGAVRDFESDGTVLHIAGDTLEDASDNLTDFMRDPGAHGFSGEAHMVHPYNQPAVMAGQATVLLETYLQLHSQGVDLMERPLKFYVGGGGFGLSNGSAVLMQELIDRGLLHADSEVVATQMEYCDSMARAQSRLNRGVTDMTGLFVDEFGQDVFDASADGTAVREPDLGNMSLAYRLRQSRGERSGVLRIITAGKEAVARGMQRASVYGYRDEEPAGALGRTGRDEELRARAPYWIADESGGYLQREAAILVAVASGGNVSGVTKREFQDTLASGALRVAGGVLFERGEPVRPPTRDVGRLARLATRSSMT